MRVLRRGDAAPERVAGVRRRDLALPLRAVQGDRIAADLLAPERGLEPLPQLPRLLLQRLGERRVADDARERGTGELGVVDIALHFAQRDGRVGEPAVGMEYRVVRILPALLHQALVAAT